MLLQIFTGNPIIDLTVNLGTRLLTGGNQRQGQRQQTPPANGNGNTGTAHRGSDGTTVQARAATPPMSRGTASFPTGGSIDSRMATWRSRMNGNNNYPASQLGTLGREVDAMLADPAQRMALMRRYGLDSAENREYLIASAVAEAGGSADSQHAGVDAGPVMAAILNRAITQNLMKELEAGHPLSARERISIRGIVNQSGQFAETPGRANSLVAGGTTTGHHERLYRRGTPARAEFDALANSVYQGNTSFNVPNRGNVNFSNVYYFHGSPTAYPRAQITASTPSHIYARMNTNDRDKPHYVFEGLRMVNGIQSNE